MLECRNVGVVILKKKKSHNFAVHLYSGFRVFPSRYNLFSFSGERGERRDAIGFLPGTVV
jgi:hypothetical protein